MTLSHKQLEFAKHVVSGLNLSQSYEAAGYSTQNLTSSSSKLAATRSVQEEIRRLRDKLSDTASMSRDRWMTLVVERAEQSEDVTERVQAMKWLGEIHSYLPSKVASQHNTFNMQDQSQNLSTLSNEDLARIANGAETLSERAETVLLGETVSLHSEGESEA